MVLIVCIMTGIATAALMSWLQPALERWAVRHPPRQATMGRSVPGRTSTGDPVPTIDLYPVITDHRFLSELHQNTRKLRI